MCSGPLREICETRVSSAVVAATTLNTTAWYAHSHTASTAHFTHMMIVTDGHHHHHHIRLLEVDIRNQKRNMFEGKRDKCENIIQYIIVQCSD